MTAATTPRPRAKPPLAGRFDDMMRVPGSEGSLLEARARGCDVRFVYSPLDARKIAVDNPARQIVSHPNSPEGACVAYYNFGRLHRQTAVLVGQQRAVVHG